MRSKMMLQLRPGYIFTFMSRPRLMQTFNFHQRAFAQEDEEDENKSFFSQKMNDQKMKTFVRVKLISTS